MTLDSLKEDYKKTFSEPRLSGKFLPEDYQKTFFESIDSAKTFDEFVQVLSKNSDRGNIERHILVRILTWNDQPPVDENGVRISEKIVKENTLLKERFLGCLVGLAVGDAYGTTYEFTDRKQMPSELPDDIVGGGPFDMKPGEWTDDTSMALCLAESIVEKGWDTDDQMRRYIKWWQDGYNSVKGTCFDIGMATRNALSWYNMTEGKQFVQDTQAAGNGVLMRLAPVPMFCYDPNDSVYVLSLSAFQSIMTHPSSQSIECSMLLGAIINKILSGEKDKKKILHFDTMLDENSKQMYKEVYEKYSCHVNSRIESIKNMEYDGVGADKISGDGYCVFTLEAALWAFLSTDNFKDGLKKVVSLGSDTDTTGAVYGQIAGAYYGINNIPWVDKIVWVDKIKSLATQIYENNKQ
jgi:ADP-ribosyl-[dinitrogen reductase] hydrolase